MRKLVYVLVGSVLIASIAWLAVHRRHLPATLEGLYAEYHRRGHAAGIGAPFRGVVLVARGGEVIFTEAYGAAGDEPLDLDSRFLIGANAEPLTATLVLQQVVAGVLDLEAPITDYLSDFPEEPGAPITLHHLLSHTAGSDSAYGSVVEILESATGKSYADLLEQRVVAPLGLTRTAFADAESLAQAIPPGVSFDEIGGPAALFSPSAGSYDEQALPTAGAVVTSVGDLHRFVVALRGNELLPGEMTARLFAPNRQGRGYGWLRNSASFFQRNPEAPLLSHLGQLAGHTAIVALYDDDTTAIVLTNVGPLDSVELLTETYLAAHGQREVSTDLKHPSLSNPRAFREGGGAEAFLAYYDTLSERAGYPIQPSPRFSTQVVQLLIREEAYGEADRFATTLLESWAPDSPEALNDIGYAFLRRDRFDEARRYFEHNIERYPDVANGYDSLGELHEAAGEFALAAKNYARAVELAKRNGDRSVGAYERNLANVAGRIAEGGVVTETP